MGKSLRRLLTANLGAGTAVVAFLSSDALGTDLRAAISEEPNDNYSNGVSYDTRLET